MNFFPRISCSIACHIEKNFVHLVVLVLQFFFSSPGEVTSISTDNLSQVLNVSVLGYPKCRLNPVTNIIIVIEVFGDKRFSQLFKRIMWHKELPVFLFKFYVLRFIFFSKKA